MLWAFQNSSFQVNAFQTAGNAAADGGDSHDGADYVGHYKHLKRIAKISDERERKKYVQIAKKLDAVVPENPLIAAAVEQVVSAIRTPDIDYDLIQANAQAAIARIEAILAYYERMALRRRKDDEEIIILLSML